MRATDDCHRHLNNSHPRFVRLPSASQSFLCWFPVKVTLVHQVHRTFHDAPYASATRAVFSWRIVPRVRRFRDDSQAVIFSSLRLTSLSPLRLRPLFTGEMPNRPRALPTTSP